MSVTRTIPKSNLGDLDLHAGDLIQVVSVGDDSLEIVVSREETVPGSGKASEWLDSARGSVKLSEGESVDDVRMEFYAAKYGISR